MKSGILNLLELSGPFQVFCF
jgi:hypothetical protein